jgi:hypothetical protein
MEVSTCNNLPSSLRPDKHGLHYLPAAIAAASLARPSAVNPTHPFVSNTTPLPRPRPLLPPSTPLPPLPTPPPPPSAGGAGVLTCTCVSCLQLGSSRALMLVLPRVKLLRREHDAAVSCCRTGLAQLRAERKRQPDTSTLCSSRLPVGEGK